MSVRTASDACIGDTTCKTVECTERVCPIAARAIWGGLVLSPCSARVILHGSSTTIYASHARSYTLRTSRILAPAGTRCSHPASGPALNGLSTSEMENGNGLPGANTRIR